MARYITVQAVKDAVPADILARLTDDREDISPPEIQESKIEASMTKAEAFIDASLAKRYFVPLVLSELPDEVGELIRPLALDMTVYFLYARVEQWAKVKDKRDQVKTVLDAIVAGSMEIPGARERRKAGVKFVAAEPIFSKKTRTVTEAD